MGGVVQHDALLVEKYGVLGVRYLLLRDLYNCVAKQMNKHETAEGCL